MPCDRNIQMWHKRILPSNVNEFSEADLRDDSAHLATCRGDAKGRGAIARRKRLSGEDRYSTVGSEVGEEIREAIQKDKCLPSLG